MKKYKGIGLIVLASFSIIPSCILPDKRNDDLPSRPNIILILADDMGFSDLGCYGGEIQTPNLDALSKEGVRYLQFYNAARCCPTRASLLTGVYPHQAGMGWMTNVDSGTSGYRGDLSKNVVTIAEVLKTAGYCTYMTGKWHVSGTRKNNGYINDNWPVQRGFDKYFGIIEGGANYFRPKVFSNNSEYPSPDNFYLTHSISDSSTQFIDQHFRKHSDSPMFMYVAYTAPHFPLQALEKDIEKYNSVYNVGWDSIREQRLKKQIELGFWKNNPELSPRDRVIPAWNDLPEEKKKDFSRRMSIYAAQVDAMDQGVGRIVAKLRELGKLDNTIIFFLSDNGGCAEFISSGKSKDLSKNLVDTYESYRINWANVSNTPFREYKHWIHEGGIRTPLIVHWPDGIRSSYENTFIDDYGHITDIMATCAELSGAHYPEVFNGNSIVPMQGKSLLPHLSGRQNDRGPIFWEHEANIGMRNKNWKLVAKTPEDETFDSTRLELYDIEADPTELSNLAEKYPEKLDSMYQVWKNWAEYANVFPLDSREYMRRLHTYQQMINGEFDMGFGDWKIYNPDNRVDFSIDEDTKLSGKNSARISVLKSFGNEDRPALSWTFRSDEYKQFEISFQAVSNKQMRLKVSVSKSENPKIVLAEETFEIGENEQTIDIKTKVIESPGQYILSFKPISGSEGNKIWLDAIQLKSL